MHEEPVGRHADLPAIGEFRRHRNVQRHFQIGILEHDQRCIAAQLHRNLLHRRGGVTDHLLADAGGAGQRDLANRCCSHDRGIGRARRPHHEAHSAVGQAAGPEAIHHHHRHARRLAGRSDDNRTSRCQRRCGLARHQRGRKVPGCEGPDNSDRFAAYFEPPARHPAFDDPAVDPARFLGIPAELLNRQNPFPQGLCNWLAGFKTDHPRTFPGAAGHIVGNPVQRVGALMARLGAPVGQASGGTFNRLLGISARRDRRAPQRFFCRRRHNVCRVAIRSAAPRSINEKSEGPIHRLSDLAEVHGAALRDRTECGLGQQ